MISNPERPAIVLRVGVTGAAELDPLMIDRLSEDVTELFRALRSQVTDASVRLSDDRIYSDANPIIRVISPLGEGADRLVVRAALAVSDAEDGCGVELMVPMPFRQEMYEETFGTAGGKNQAESVTEFRNLLALAESRTFELDGDVLDDSIRARSYEAVGQFVVRNSDILIAVWDDERVPRGRGGTSDVVQFALRAGVPIWWLHPSKKSGPRWLGDKFDLFERKANPSADFESHDPWNRLSNHVQQLFFPPALERVESKKLVERIISSQRKRAGLDNDPLAAYLNEKATKPSLLSRLHPNLFAILRRVGRLHHSKNEIKDDISNDKFYNEILLKSKIDSKFSNVSSFPAYLSRGYKDRYRSSYVIVFVCAALALIFVALGLATPEAMSSMEHEWELASTIIEAILIFIIGITIYLNRVNRWHERYINYRMLGELNRLLHFTSKFGWVFPTSRVNNTSKSQRSSWVGWYFDAVRRSQPLCTGICDSARMNDVIDEIKNSLIFEQFIYHKNKRDESIELSEWLSLWGGRLFVATIIVIILKFLLLGFHVLPELIMMLSVLGVIFPALSAASFGVKSYEEFEVIIQQSQHMLDCLSGSHNRISKIDSKIPLASQMIGIEISDICVNMLSDVDGWAQLFRMKIVEA